MKRNIIIAASLFVFTLATSASALTVTPKLAKAFWFLSDIGGFYKTTNFIVGNQVACFPEKLVYVSQMQMRVSTGIQPVNESCWFYDQNGPQYNWVQANSGCLPYSEGIDDQVWWKETADAYNGFEGTYRYGTIAQPYMAYGYVENGYWNYKAYWAQGLCS